MSDAKDRTLEDLRGSFRYAWLLCGVVDVAAGVLGSFHFMEGVDLNQGGPQLTILGILLLTSTIAFFCGSQFRADKNREILLDDAQALVNTYKAATDKVEWDCAGKVQQSEHRIGELTTQLEAEKTRAASVDELRRSLAAANQDVEDAIERNSALESRVNELEDELAKQRNGEEQRLAEHREHVIRAHNFIGQLNKPEAKALRSLINGNNQLLITAPGTTGLLAFGAIKYLANTGSYVPGEGELGYFTVNPIWRTYASWERDLLDQRAEGNGDEARRRFDAIHGVREAVGFGLVIQDGGLYMPDGTGAYKMIASQAEMTGSESEAEKREVFDSLNEREKWCLAHIVMISPRKFSASGSVLIPSFEVLTREGIVIGLESEVVNGEERHVYTIDPKWRGWISSHSNELPDPKPPIPA